MKRGLTLLELLLVLGLLALVFFPLLSLLSSGLTASSEIEGTSTALQLAQEKMESIKNLAFASIVSEDRSDVPDLPGYQREVIVNNLNATLIEVSVRVYWKVKNSELNLTLQTLITST